MSKPHTSLLNRFIFQTPEENLVAAILRQAWCDAFMIITAEGEYYGYHQRQEQRYAKRMFEGQPKDEWRQSLRVLASAIEIDDNSLVDGYFKYKKVVKKSEVEPEKAFDILLKTLI